MKSKLSQSWQHEAPAALGVSSHPSQASLPYEGNQGDVFSRQQRISLLLSTLTYRHVQAKSDDWLTDSELTSLFSPAMRTLTVMETIQERYIFFFNKISLLLVSGMPEPCRAVCCFWKAFNNFNEVFISGSISRTHVQDARGGCRPWLSFSWLSDPFILPTLDLGPLDLAVSVFHAPKKKERSLYYLVLTDTRVRERAGVFGSQSGYYFHGKRKKKTLFHRHLIMLFVFLMLYVSSRTNNASIVDGFFACYGVYRMENYACGESVFLWIAWRSRCELSF